MSNPDLPSPVHSSNKDDRMRVAYREDPQPIAAQLGSLGIEIQGVASERNMNHLFFTLPANVPATSIVEALNYSENALSAVTPLVQQGIMCAAAKGAARGMETIRHTPQAIFNADPVLAVSKPQQSSGRVASV